MINLTKTEREVVDRLAGLRRNELSEGRRTLVRPRRVEVLDRWAHHPHQMQTPDEFHGRRVIKGGCDWNLPPCATCSHQPLRYLHIEVEFVANRFDRAEINGTGLRSLKVLWEATERLLNFDYPGYNVFVFQRLLRGPLSEDALRQLRES